MFTKLFRSLLIVAGLLLLVRLSVAKAQQFKELQTFWNQAISLGELMGAYGIWLSVFSRKVVLETMYDWPFAMVLPGLVLGYFTVPVRGAAVGTALAFTSFTTFWVTAFVCAILMSLSKTGAGLDEQKGEIISEYHKRRGLEELRAARWRHHNN